jgi:hypothetical protein
VAVSIFDFPDRRDATTAQIYQDVRTILLPQLERVILLNQSIGTTSTAIAHGMRGIPRFIHVTPQADARVWRSAVSDSVRIYLQASAAVTCDIEVAL